MGDSKVFNGVIWASAQRFGSMAISFVSNMVLARLLTPDDFGSIGMLMFFIAIAQTFVDSGFGSALIQKKEISQEDKSTVFVINIVMSVLLYSMLFFSAPAISRFYNVPALSDLLRVMGLVVIINGFGLVQSAQLQKQMQFKKLSICNLLGSIIIAISGISAALLGCGVWSLVIRTLCGAVVTNLLLLVACRWKPSFTFNRESFRKLFGFGGFMLLSSTLITITNNVQTLVIGKLFSQRSLGNYTQAHSLRNVFSDSISSIIGQVLYPDFAKHQDDDEEIRRRLDNSAYLISYVVAPVMLFCVVSGAHLIRTVYGGQWDEAIPYFEILCIGGIPFSLQDININVIKAKGHSKVLFICNLIKVLIYFALMLFGAKLGGMTGLVISMVTYTALAYLAFAIIGTYYVGTNIASQLVNIARTVLLSLPSSIACYFINMNVHAGEFALCMIEFIVFFVIYVSLSLAFKPYPFKFLLEHLKIKQFNN